MLVRALPHRRALLALSLATALPLVGGCEPRRDRTRFRLTLRLVAREGTFTGSSVRETWYTEDPFWFPSDNAPNPGWRGEATVVSLGRGRVLCGMLEGYSTVTGRRERSYSPWNPFEVLLQRRWGPIPGDLEDGRPRFRGERPTTEAMLAELRAADLVLRPEELPLLVAFEDASVAGSGRLIHPEDVGEVFPGMRLGRCTLQLTRDAVRYGEAARAMPWIDDGPARATIQQGGSSTIVTGDFVRN